VTDRQTDRQNYDPQDRASIAASRSKNVKKSDSTASNVLQYDENVLPEAG